MFLFPLCSFVLKPRTFLIPHPLSHSFNRPVVFLTLISSLCHPRPLPLLFLIFIFLLFISIRLYIFSSFPFPLSSILFLSISSSTFVFSSFLYMNPKHPTFHPPSPRYSLYRLQTVLLAGIHRLLGDKKCLALH